MKNTNTKEFAITRVFDAPLETIWKMWTEPEKIKKWFGPKGYTSTSATVDLTVGGKYLINMKGSMDPKEPVMEMWSGGTYKEIIPFEKIVCTDSFSDENGNVIDPASFGLDPLFPKEQDVTITFDKYGKDKTKLTITYHPESDEVIMIMEDAKMRDGWKSSLDKLAENL